MEFKIVEIEKSDEINVIMGMSHFIKTCKDFHEALVETVPGIKFGLAFCEASGKRLIRTQGTDQDLIDLAARNARAVGAGHSFILMLGNAYPINVLRVLRNVSETVSFYCATANPVQAVIAETEQGRGIMGVIDGFMPLGIETADDKVERRDFLMKIGYKES